MNSCGKDEILRHPTDVIRGDRFQSSFRSTDIIIYGPFGAPDSKLFAVADSILSDSIWHGTWLTRYCIHFDNTRSSS